MVLFVPMTERIGLKKVRTPEDYLRCARLLLPRSPKTPAEIVEENGLIDTSKILSIYSRATEIEVKKGLLDPQEYSLRQERIQSAKEAMLHRAVVLADGHLFVWRQFGKESVPTFRESAIDLNLTSADELEELLYAMRIHVNSMMRKGMSASLLSQISDRINQYEILLAGKKLSSGQALEGIRSDVANGISIAPRRGRPPFRRVIK